jgi:formamidopyrimidine-DNA glycosylase
VPELPEVEVTRQRIEPLLVGRRIRAARTTRASQLFITPPARLRRGLAGRTVEELGRRGKYLLARLDGGSRLVLHLGMTGQLLSSAAVSERLLPAAARASEASRPFRPDLHTHLRLGFDDGGPEVFFRDVRRFGKVLLLGRGESHPRLDRLGADALEASGETLFRATRKRKAAIKAVLLDQSLIAGIGNIYADEVLFLTGVRPGRRAGLLTRRECRRLAETIRRVMRRSIEAGGSTISDYVAPDGSDGSYQLERKVYARDGEPCTACGSGVRKTVVAQRGTHYCPVCQR